MRAGGRGGEVVEAKLAAAARSLRAALKTASAPEDRIEALRKAVHETLELRPETDPTREHLLTALFPQAVLRSRKGACLGLSLIYLELGRRAGLPVHGVHIPGHFFVRYRAGGRAWNLETTLSGVIRSDAYYRKKAGLGPRQVGSYLSDLRPDGVAASVLNNLGGAELRARRPRRALPHLKAAVRLAPKYLDARYNLAYAHRELGDRRSAVREADAALAIWPGFKRARTLRGLLRLDLGQVAAARADFERVVREHPADPGAWCQLGVARQVSDDLTGAEQAYAKALTLRPRFARALLGRGLLSLRRGKVDAAAKDLSGVEVRVDWADLFRTLPAKAAADLERLGARLSKRRRASTQAYLAAGRGYLGLKRAGEARRAYDRALSAGGDPVGAYCGRGLAAAAAGDELWTKRNFYLATQSDPKDPRGYLCFGNHYLARDEYTIALEYYRKYLKRAKGHPERARIVKLVKELAAALKPN